MTIFEFTRLGEYKAATSPGLALYALEKGFAVDHIVKFEEIFKYPDASLPGYTMPRDEFEEKIALDKLFFAQAETKGLQTLIIPDMVESTILKNYLKEGILLLAMIDVGGLLHDIVIRGFWHDIYLIVDPARGERSVHKRELMHLIDTRYGISILAVYPKEKLKNNYG